MRRMPGHTGLAVTAALLAGAAALASADPQPQASDRQNLERALFLCQWKGSHDVPESAPIPAVCKSSAVSTEDALLQDKQWWTFWARLNPDQAQQASQLFSTDFAAFQARQKLQPQLALQLLPAGLKLPPDDWRVRLVRQLSRPVSAAR